MLTGDVTDDASVAAVVKSVIDETGRIDLLVNNAGSGLSGGAEEFSTDEAKALFDVNVFGIARMTRAVLPTMRAQGQGRIVNISSILGLVPTPFMALYSATKFAVEGYSESLDHEVRHFGIRVVLVEPGFTNTSFEQNRTLPDQPMPLYDRARANVDAYFRKLAATGDSAELVADVVLKAAQDRSPKTRYLAGKKRPSAQHAPAPHASAAVRQGATQGDDSACVKKRGRKRQETFGNSRAARVTQEGLELGDNVRFRDRVTCRGQMTVVG